MNIRTLSLAALLFFALAPAALAQSMNGSGCDTNATCVSNYCKLGDFAGGSAKAGTCRPSDAYCVWDSECGTNYYCAESNTCQPVATGASATYCVWDSECPSNYYCNESNACQLVGGTQTSTGNGNNQTQTSTGNSGNTATGTSVTLINPLGTGSTLESFLVAILSFVVRIGAVVVVLMLVYVGYLFVIARGEPAKISEARQSLLWTVVGALILLGAVAIAKGIQATVQALSVGQ